MCTFEPLRPVRAESALLVSRCTRNFVGLASVRATAHGPLPTSLRPQTRLAAAALPLVKVCGIVHPEDAEIAVAAGADFLGIILSPRFKRCPKTETCKQIVAVGRRLAVPVVGVFVHEDARAISARALEVGLDFVQLHGDAARSAFQNLPKQIDTIYVVHAGQDGGLQLRHSGLRDEFDHLRRQPGWLLVDGMNPGSGEAYDWSKVKIPLGIAQHGWMLAGGLKHTNVSEVLAAVQPHAVDVSSGTAGPDGLRKDAEKVEAFISAVRKARTAQSA